MHVDGVLFAGNLDDAANQLIEESVKLHGERERIEDGDESMFCIDVNYTAAEMQEMFDDSDENSYEEWEQNCEVGFFRQYFIAQDHTPILGKTVTSMYAMLEDACEELYNALEVHHRRKGTELEQFNSGTHRLTAKAEGHILAILESLRNLGNDASFEKFCNRLHSDDVKWLRISPTKWFKQFPVLSIGQARLLETVSWEVARVAKLFSI